MGKQKTPVRLEKVQVDPNDEKDVMSKEDQSQGADSRSLTYFSHTTPDQRSFPKAIANGSVIINGSDIADNGKFEIIKKQRPPYK